MDNEIVAYYNQLSSEYDTNRFGNSYGSFIHNQEVHILRNFFENKKNEAVLDLACGTGRLTEFASHGMDLSSQMLALGQKKHPEKHFSHSDAEHTNFESEFFDDVFSFHFLMHLDEEKTKKIVDEVHRILKPKGRFIFDIPSKKRRTVLGRKNTNWHGSQALSKVEISKLVSDRFTVKSYKAYLFIPIHRFPVFIRKPLQQIDAWLCSSFVKDYSSYLVFELQKI